MPLPGHSTDHKASVVYFLLIAFDNSAPPLNLANFLADILMVFPFWGLVPLRASLLRTEKVPNPISETFLPFLSALVVRSINELRARSASDLESFASLAMASINSGLYMFFGFMVF